MDNRQAAVKDVLGTEEAALLLDVHVVTLRTLAHDGKIPARKIGRDWKFNRIALLEYLRGDTLCQGEKPMTDCGRTRAEPGTSKPTSQAAVSAALRSRRTGGKRKNSAIPLRLVRGGPGN